MGNAKEAQFAILAEAEGYERPLIVTDLTFARLLDDIVVPFEIDKPFFIDGVPLTKNKIKKLKIIKQAKHFQEIFTHLHLNLRRASTNIQKTIGDQYHVRLEAILREGGEDVTSQVIKAFDTTIRPKLKDYMPKREQLIQATFDVFIQGMKLLGSAGS